MNIQLNSNNISVTKILIGINVFIFILMYFPPFNWNDFFRLNFMSSGIVEYNKGLQTYVTVFQDGNFYRLLTANFLHSGPTHIIMNMMGLYILGEATESMVGKKKFVLMYIVSALGTTLLCAIVNICFNPYGFEPVLGASGAVLGIGGCLAGIVLYRKINKIYYMFEIDYKPLLIMLGLNVAIGLVPGISLTGHLGGILAGVLMGYLYGFLIEKSKRI